MGSLYLHQLGSGLLNSQLPTKVSISDGCLQGHPLAFEVLGLILELADVLNHLENLLSLCNRGHLVLPSQCLQLLVLDLVHGLGLRPAEVSDVLLPVIDLGDDADHVHGQHRGRVRDPGLHLTDLLFIYVPSADLISQPFRRNSSSTLFSFLHILLDEDRFILHECMLFDLLLYSFLKSSTSPCKLPCSPLASAPPGLVSSCSPSSGTWCTCCELFAAAAEFCSAAAGATTCR